MSQQYQQGFSFNSSAGPMTNFNYFNLNDEQASLDVTKVNKYFKRIFQCQFLSSFTSYSLLEFLLT
jgi:hypothetical protein